ncbi:MAG: MurR/RpiR family transcriptional regulator [Erysipelotrichaceae bacterium]|nr:MurR/RpiR family transcriptional regulator [Erysipelotrichaceae bacterium]
MKQETDNKIRGIVRFNLLTSLLSILNTNDENDTDFIIARYLLENMETIKDTSIYTVADECYVSRSSIQRFIKNIGYDSFKQMKMYIDDILEHEKSFIMYTDHSNYRDYIGSSIKNVLDDVISASKMINFKKLVRKFISKDRIVILSAEDSSSACRLFQQQILANGKLIRLLTSANSNLSLLKELTKNDLLLVCSVTGNFAIAINDQLKDIKAEKCLITLNTTSLFEDSYSLICYLGEKGKFSSRTIHSLRNEYSNYGLTLFFDLFYHDCFIENE